MHNSVSITEFNLNKNCKICVFQSNLQRVFRKWSNPCTVVPFYIYYSPTFPCLNEYVILYPANH